MTIYPPETSPQIKLKPLVQTRDQHGLSHRLEDLRVLVPVDGTGGVAVSGTRDVRDGVVAAHRVVRLCRGQHQHFRSDWRSQEVRQ